jgi:hypothetical protein
VPVEGDAVAIYRLLQNSAFGPEDIERLSAAYEDGIAPPSPRAFLMP